MQRYLLIRIFQSVFVLLGILLLVFFLLRVTGDPVNLMFASKMRYVSPTQIEAFRKSMGFDLPLGVQFVNYFRKALVGDFGESFRYGLPAMDLILER